MKTVIRSKQLNDKSGASFGVRIWDISKGSMIFKSLVTQLSLLKSQMQCGCFGMRKHRLSLVIDSGYSLRSTSAQAMNSKRTEKKDLINKVLCFSFFEQSKIFRINLEKAIVILKIPTKIR